MMLLVESWLRKSRSRFLTSHRRTTMPFDKKKAREEAIAAAKAEIAAEEEAKKKQPSK